MNRIARCRSRRSSSRMATISAWIVTSSAVVGSSAIRSSGSAASAPAIMTRWSIPPESSSGYDRCVRSGSLMPTSAEELERPVPGSCRGPSRRAPGAPRRCDRRSGTGDRCAPAGPGRSSPRDARGARAGPRVETQDLDPVEDHAPGQARAGRQQAENRPGGHRLAAAGLADEADHLATIDREADSTHDRQVLPIDRQLGRQVANLEEARVIAPPSGG